MAARVTEQDKINMNELYVRFKTYAAVARETGFSPSTVKKYIVPNYVSINNIKINKFNGEIPTEFLPFPKSQNDWENLLQLTTDELEELKELREEINL